MYSGKDAWNGILDNKAAGACTHAFPLYRTSRIVAGAPIEGGIYRLRAEIPCAGGGRMARMAVGDRTPSEMNQLQQIFPEGVCDYSRPDQARPRWLDWR